MHDLDASEMLDDSPPSSCASDPTFSRELSRADCESLTFSSSASESDLCPFEGQGVGTRAWNLSNALTFLSLNSLRFELLEGTHGAAFSMGGSSS